MAPWYGPKGRTAGALKAAEYVDRAAPGLVTVLGRDAQPDRVVACVRKRQLQRGAKRPVRVVLGQAKGREAPVEAAEIDGSVFDADLAERHREGAVVGLDAERGRPPGVQPGIEPGQVPSRTGFEDDRGRVLLAERQFRVPGIDGTESTDRGILEAGPALPLGKNGSPSFGRKPGADPGTE